MGGLIDPFNFTFPGSITRRVHDEQSFAQLVNESHPPLTLYPAVRITQELTPSLTHDLCHFMSTSQCLIKLTLSSSSISDDLIADLAPGLRNCSQLALLDLSRNNVSDAGVKILVNLFANHYSLNRLNLSHNRVTSDGCKLIAVALRENETLETLDLSSNRIEDEGGIQLFQALCVNLSVQEVSLSCNYLSRKSLPFIANLLAESTILVKLDVSGNRMGDQLNSEKFEILLHCLLKNQKIEIFDIRGCGFSYDQCEQLVPPKRRIHKPLLARRSM